MTTIDFGKALRDAKGASFEALPRGDYDVEVAQADAVRASSGKPMIKAIMRVLFGPYQGRQVFNNFVLSLENPQAMSIWFRHMRAFGLKDDFFAQLGNAGLEPVASALVGRRARLTLGIRQWQGEDRNEVNVVKPFTGAPPTAGPVAGPTPTTPAPTPAATPPTPPTPPTPSPVTTHPAAVAAQQLAQAGQPGPIAQVPTQVAQQFQPVYEAAVAQEPSAPPPPQFAPTPVIEAAPFDGTSPTAVPTDGGYPAAVPSHTPSTAPTSESTPPPPVAPELPI